MDISGIIEYFIFKFLYFKNKYKKQYIWKNDWIHIDQSGLNIGSYREDFGPAETIYFISPYDIPIYIRSARYEGKLIVEFKYIDEEKSFTQRHKRIKDCNINMRIGKNSGRVYGVIISTMNQLIDSELFFIKKAIENNNINPKWYQKKRSKKTMKEEHFKIILKIIDRYKIRLFSYNYQDKREYIT